MIYQIAIGFDPRQSISYNVCQFSLLRRASQPIAITPLVIETLPLKRQGLTPFSFTRFLVPHLFGYRGWVLFMDADIIAWEDPICIWDYADPQKAVIVAEGVMPFERAAVMLFNCGHPDNRRLTPEYIEKADGLHTIGWTKEIGTFPTKFNHCCGYAEADPEPGLIHFTQGVPAWGETADSEHQEKWVNELRLMNSTQSWAELLGKSIHAVDTPYGKQPRYKAQQWLSETIPISSPPLNPG